MEPVKHVKPSKDVDELVKGMRHTSFGGRKISEATDIFEDMIKDKDCSVFLGVAGALVPGGQRQLIVEMIRNGWVQALVTTGANLSHDLMEAFGKRHMIGDEHVNDEELLKKGFSRVYDTYMPRDAYGIVEDHLQELLKKLSKNKRLPVSRFLKELGATIEDKNSIIRACYDRGVPIFCPAIADSFLGIQLWMFSQDKDWWIDVTSDRTELTNLIYNSEKNGVIILSGGTPKNFLLQTMEMTNKTFDYGVQITTDRPEPGGLSGATLQEAVSWKKISPNANFVDVYCDVTIVLPLIISALKERLNILK